MTTLLVSGLVAAVVLLLAIAYLAVLETVLTRLNVVRALRLDEEDRRGASALLWLTERRATSANVVLVLADLARVAVGGVAAGVGWATIGGPTGALLGIGVVALLVLVLGEVAPRTASLRRLEGAGLRLAPSARLLVRLAEPVARVLVSVGARLVSRGDEVSGPYASDDELRQMEADTPPDEQIEPEERAMIRSIFELADTIVREIMRPRPDMVTVAGDANLDDVVAAVIEHGYSRLPVHDPDDPDTVLGVVNAKDLLRRMASDGPATSWEDLVRPPTFVPETKRCDDLLRELQQGTVHLALVVDEYGELAGLVTIEDILEEIVGEIVDEHDREEPLVELLAGGVMRIDARLPVDDLNDLLGSQLPEEGWDTVAGLVVGTLGHVPVEGERLELEGTVITVERIQGRRVGKVLVKPDEERSARNDSQESTDPIDGSARGHQQPG